MRRGFKAEAERRAEAIRKQMGRRPTDRADAIRIAQHLGAEVRRADELTSLAKLQALEELQPGAFSACTFTFGDRHVIVYSPLASPARRQSDVAHEAAHILLGHEVKEVQHIGGLSFFTCDPDEEQEANWQAGCLLLPRSLVLAAARRDLDAVSIAENLWSVRVNGWISPSQYRGPQATPGGQPDRWVAWSNSGPTRIGHCCSTTAEARLGME